MSQDNATVVEPRSPVFLFTKQTNLPVTSEVHIWYALVDRPASGFRELLSQDERERARRFIYERDRVRYIIRRGILRILLGNYLGIAPHNVNINIGKNGKPALADEHAHIGLNFNMSHSEGTAVYAFTTGREIGVDIERLRDIPDMVQVFERFFSPAENAAFRVLPESMKQEAFFNCWTRKEAFVKATGDGLSRPLDRFDVSFIPGGPTRLLEIAGDMAEAPQWSMQDLKDAPGYKAALAVKGTCGNIRSWQWQDRYQSTELF